MPSSYYAALDPDLDMRVVRAPGPEYAHPRVLIIPTTNRMYYDNEGNLLPKYWGQRRAIVGYPGYELHEDEHSFYSHEKIRKK